MKSLWRKWKSGVHRINDGIAWVLMSLTFFLAVMPVSLTFKLMRKDLLDRGLGGKGTKTCWLTTKNEPMDVRAQRRTADGGPFIVGVW